MHRYILAVMSSFYLTSYGLSHVFKNNTNVTLQISARSPALRKGVPGATACNITLEPHKSQMCNTGNICPKVLEVRKNIFQGNTFQIGAECKNTEFTINTTNPGSIQEFTLTQKPL